MLETNNGFMQSRGRKTPEKAFFINIDGEALKANTAMKRAQINKEQPVELRHCITDSGCEGR